MSSDSTTAVLERRMTTDEALDWAFVQCEGLEAAGPTHLAKFIAGRTGAEANALDRKITEMLKSGMLKVKRHGDVASYWRVKPGEKVAPRKKRTRFHTGALD